MKPVDVKSITYVDFGFETQDKHSLNFKLVTMSEYQERKVFLQKRLHFNLDWRSFSDQKVKHTVSWTNFCSDINGEKIVRRSYIKHLKRKNQHRAEL